MFFKYYVLLMGVGVVGFLFFWPTLPLYFSVEHDRS